MWFHGIWAEVDDFVLFVESCGGVGLGHGFEGRFDQVCGIVDEVFGWGGCVSLVECILSKATAFVHDIVP